MVFTATSRRRNPEFASIAPMHHEPDPNRDTGNPVERARTRARRRGTPWPLVMLRLYFSTIGRILPWLAARTAYRLWFRTRRHPTPAREARWLSGARQDRIDHEYGPLAVDVWGEEGPTVLLVHGWDGRGSQMGAFAQPLVDVGFRVVAFDLPAHGKSPGDSTNVFRVMDALEAVADAYGPVHGVIAHSFGVFATTLALADHIEARAVVCISSPNSLHWLAARFARILRIPNATWQIFIRRVERKFGSDIWERLTLSHAAAKLDVPALIIHDENDYDVLWEQGEKLAAHWPGAQFMKTHGLGHRRILRDIGVVDAAVRFLAHRRTP
jgi:pimeloyl-ACP methyl ester carboxylesterase